MSMHKVVIYLTLFLCCYKAGSQTQWDIKAQIHSFVNSQFFETYKLTAAEDTIKITSSFIDTYSDSSSKKILGSLYLLRAKMRHFTLVENKMTGNKSSGLTTAINETDSDFRMALNLCAYCECRILPEIKKFYYHFMDSAKVDSMELAVRKVGIPEMLYYAGFGVNYSPYIKVVGGDIGGFIFSTIFQPKKRHTPLLKKYRKCNYKYPIAAGLLFFGIEGSFLPSSYAAFKLDLLWFHNVISVHPFQIMRAIYQGERGFIYRGELGVSFSTLSINYSLNIPFEKDFKALPIHSINLRLFIPFIKQL